MSTSRLVLIRNVGNELKRVSGTCSAAGTTTTIVDTSGDSPLDPDDDERKYANAWAYIEADSAGTPLNVGELRRVSSYVPDNGTLTLSRALSNATTATQSYGIYFKRPPIRLAEYKGIADYINETLRNVVYRTRHLMTLVTDGDMETSGTTSWTASNSTLTKLTAAANVRLGKQAMQVANSSASGYARSGLVDVSPYQNYAVAADCRAISGTARLVLYDETNGATIDDRTSDIYGWRWLHFNYTIPSGCERVSVRLVGDEATADLYWDNVSLRNVAATRMDLPSWVVNENAIEEVGVWRGGTGTASTDDEAGDYAVDERYAGVLHWWEIVEDATGLTPKRLEFWPLPSSDELLVLRGLRVYDELDDDTDTTDCPADLALAGALTKIYRELGDAANYTYWKARYNSYLGIYQPRLSRRSKGTRPY